MLKRHSALDHAVSQIMAQSVQGNQLIVACEGTPLHDVATACIGLGSMNEKSLGSDRVGGASQLVRGITYDSKYHDTQTIRQEQHEDYTVNYEISAHTARYSGVATQVAALIKRNLVLAEEASELIGRAFDDLRTTFNVNDRIIPIKIVTMIGGELTNDGTLAGYAKSKIPANQSLRDLAEIPTSFPYIENLDDLPVVKLLNTGISALDTQLNEWALKGGARLIHSVYNRFFTATVENNQRGYVKLGIADLDRIDNSATELDVAIALLLLSVNLDDAGLAYTNNGLSLDEIEYGLNTVKLFSAARIIAFLERIQQGREQGKLVYKYPSVVRAGDNWQDSVFEIIVDKVVYDDFLDSGGSVEIIYGSYLSQHYYNKIDLLNEPERFIAAWKDGEARLRRERNQSELARIYSAVRNRTYRDFNDLPQEHRDKITSDSVANELARFNKHLTSENLAHLYDFVRELYTSIFYPGTEVGCLLRCIDEVRAEGDMSRESILRIAVTEYAAKWLMEQTHSVEYHEPTGNLAAGNTDEEV